MIALGQAVLELLYPSKCPLCGRLLATGEEEICTSCTQALPWTGEGHLWKGSFLRQCGAPLYYEGALRQAFLRYKFSGREEYALLFGRLMAEELTSWPERPQVISWVPLSRRHLRRRGYDQAELLAREVSRRLDLPLEPLLKKENRRAQSSLGGGERQANIQGAYTLRPGAAVEGRYILLVDDLITTGSTLEECARTLGRAGAGRVDGLTLARSREGDGCKPEEYRL